MLLLVGLVVCCWGVGKSQQGRAAARAERTFGMVREAFELDLQNQDFDLSRSDPP